MIVKAVFASWHKQCNNVCRGKNVWNILGWYGLVWFGVVRFGWLCYCRPSPLPLPPMPLCGPSWEDSLFWAGGRTSEWMSESSGGILQLPLFVYTSQSRHTSLAAQPTDNLWCPNHRWLWSCTETPVVCTPAWPAAHGPYIQTQTQSCFLWSARTVEPGVSSWAKRHGVVGWRQSQGTRFSSQRCERPATQKHKTSYLVLPSSDDKW